MSMATVTSLDGLTPKPSSPEGIWMPVLAVETSVLLE